MVGRDPQEVEQKLRIGSQKYLYAFRSGLNLEKFINHYKKKHYSFKKKKLLINANVFKLSSPTQSLNTLLALPYL